MRKASALALLCVLASSLLVAQETAEQDARLEELLETLGGGDARRGRDVFYSAKAACASCHALDSPGGKIGPDLTGIGRVRSERDLLESIVFPNARFVLGYEPVVVATRAGMVVRGIIRKQAADEVVLATGPDQEVRLARQDIVELRPGNVSVMPAGLDRLLTRRELADLLAFLKACR